MKEEKKSHNFNVQNSSNVQEETKKKNKKKYNPKNTSYYYYKNQKKKKNKNKLQETTVLEIIDEDTIKEEKDIEKDVFVQEEKKDNVVIEEKQENKNDKKKSVNKDKESSETQEEQKDITFDDVPSNVKKSSKINSIKKELDNFYTTDETSVKEEKKIELSKLAPLEETLTDIDPIIKFKSNPLPKKKRKKKKDDLLPVFEEPAVKKEKTSKKKEKIKDKDDLIITREINFDYDAKDLKKKKVLNELKEAIEDFDRMELLDEKNASKDNIKEELSNIEEKVVEVEEVVEPKKENVLEIAQELDSKEKEKQVKETKKDKNKKGILSLFKKEVKNVNRGKNETSVNVNPLDTINMPEPIELPRMKGEKSSEKYLDTKMQPMIEEDKFTQILNKIDLEEKLKELANSDESGNYLAETFLNLKNSKESSIQYDVYSKRKIYWMLGIAILVIILLIIIFLYASNNSNNEFISTSYSSSIVDKEDNKEELFKQCLSSSYDVNDKDLELAEKEQEISLYVKSHYKASLIYQDLDTSYSYGYNSSEVYYAASTIKLLDALYIYTKASQGEIDLDTTIVYTDRYKLDSSLELSNHSYGEAISIRDLVKYAVQVSDNSAHAMLVSYIGRSKLKDFGNELGATNTMVGSDNFGSISGLDAIIYLNAVNSFINSDVTYGEELKNLLIGADQAYLNLSDSIVSAHKYGHYEKYYHNIGIVYDEHPYMIAILTHEGFNSNRENMIKDINGKIYELHKLYYEKKDAMCYSKIYLD